MVSGVGFSELLLLFVIGLLILGPERLPRVASQLGRWVGKARRTANQLRFQMERELALADIERSQKQKPKNNKPGDGGAPPPGTDAGADAAAPPESAAGDTAGGATQSTHDASPRGADTDGSDADKS